jgi:hypothetical protein
MEYFVVLNLNRDLVDYNPGDTVDLPEDVAQDLLAAGVISTEKVERASVEAPVEEQPKPEPVVGGSPAQSGEPSIDASESPVSTPAKDVTFVLEDMTRAELNAHATDKGIDPAVVESAPNKAAVIDLINNAPDPSANL